MDIAGVAGPLGGMGHPIGSDGNRALQPTSVSTHQQLVHTHGSARVE